MSDIRILDGGLGTTLEDRYNVVFTQDRPLWSSDLLVSDPATLLACQRDFVAAGADVILTATYQTSVEAFARTRTPEHPDGIAPASATLPYLGRAVDIATQAAADTGAEVALSCGPYGAAMTPGQEYTGAYDAAHATAHALAAWHAARLALHAAAAASAAPRRVQYLAFETVPNLAEIAAVREAAARRPAALLPARFWICAVFPHPGDDDRLADGSSVESVVEAMLAPRPGAARPWGIGINCTKTHKLDRLVAGFERCVAALAARGVLAAPEDVPALVLYPDGTNGEVYNTTTKKWETPVTPGTVSPKEPWHIQLARTVEQARARGVFKSFLVGGCCKANPQNIKDLCMTLNPSSK